MAPLLSQARPTHQMMTELNSVSSTRHRSPPRLTVGLVLVIKIFFCKTQVLEKKKIVQREEECARETLHCSGPTPLKFTHHPRPRRSRRRPPRSPSRGRRDPHAPRRTHPPLEEEKNMSSSVSCAQERHEIKSFTTYPCPGIDGQCTG